MKAEVDFRPSENGQGPARYYIRLRPETVEEVGELMLADRLEFVPTEMGPVNNPDDLHYVLVFDNRATREWDNG